MKRLASGFFSLALLASPARAQEPLDKPLPGSLSIAPTQVTATPEMWFYEQELRRTEDPRVAVRQKAELRAAQRNARLASLKWFGFSNSRPHAGTDPVHGGYSPRWVSNNFIASEWVGPGTANVAVIVDRVRR